jgi:hypothetical protein
MGGHAAPRVERSVPATAARRRRTARPGTLRARALSRRSKAEFARVERDLGDAGADLDWLAGSSGREACSSAGLLRAARVSRVMPAASGRRRPDQDDLAAASFRRAASLVGLAARLLRDPDAARTSRRRIISRRGAQGC